MTTLPSARGDRITGSLFLGSHHCGWQAGRREANPVLALRKTKIIATVSNFRVAPYFALHKGIAIGFLKAIRFSHQP